MNRPYRYRDQWPIIAKRIDNFKIAPGRLSEFQRIAEYYIKHKDILLEVEQKSNVPWPMLAAILEREADSDSKFNCYLGNGQPLNRRTTIVPVGRGPWCSSLPAPREAFVKAALDALAIDHLDKVIPPWPIEKQLFWVEPFNGLGYFGMGLPSPYIWGGSNVQVRGKYTSDGHFDPTVWDTQPGCASILWMLGALDTSIHYTRES
jgi:lysozyme family protein